MKRVLLSLFIFLSFLVGCSTTVKKKDASPKGVADAPAAKSEVVATSVKSEFVLPDGLTTRETERGTILVFTPKIIFKYADSKIPESASNVFSLVKYVIDNNTNVNIVLEGHTGNMGVAYPFNYQLSVDRVEAGRKYMISIGIETSRFTTMPLGEALPEFDNQKDLRRYEFVLIRNESDKIKYNNFIKTIDVKKDTNIQGE